MDQQPHRKPALPFIRRLCAHLSEEKLVEAEASFWRTVEIVRGIHERIKREKAAGHHSTNPDADSKI